MANQDQLDQAHEAIRKGERSRILFEMMLSEIGASFEDTRTEVWDKLKQTQEDYEQAIKNLSLLIKTTHTTEGVSVSN